MEDFGFEDLLSDTAFNTAPVVPEPITEVATVTEDEEITDTKETPIEAEPIEVEESEEDDRITATYEFLKEAEFLDLPEDFTFDGTPEKFQEALELSRKVVYEKTADAFFEALPEQFKPLLTYALKGGNSVDEYVKLYSTQAFEHLDPNKEEDQKAILFQHYKTTSNYDDAKIQRIIARLNEDDLPEAATEAYNELLEMKTERQAQLIEDAAKAKEQQIEESKRRVEELTKAIETTPLLDDTRRNKVKGFFHNRLNVGGVETTEFNYTVERIFNNPEHLAQLADLLTEYDPKKGISTKRIEQKGATKETTKFKTLLTEKLNSKPKASHTGATSNEPPNFLEKFTEL
jgi:cell fate (sporulation/competence/biofilm development) regulator YmcA (YheA/YmcA/DUF963 family)